MIARILISLIFSFAVCFHQARLEADTFSIASPTTLTLIKAKTDTAISALGGRFSLSLFSRFASSFSPRICRFIPSSSILSFISCSHIYDGADDTLSRRIVNETKTCRARWFIVWLSRDRIHLSLLTDNSFARSFIYLYPFASLTLVKNYCRKRRIRRFLFFLFNDCKRIILQKHDR